MEDKIKKILEDYKVYGVKQDLITEDLLVLFSELLIAFDTMREFDIKHDDIEESVDYFLKNKESYL